MSKEFKEWYKVIEIADLLKLSKVSIYNKIKTLNSGTLQPLQHKEKGVMYYNYKIIDMLRDGAILHTPPVVMDQDEAAAEESILSYQDEYIDSLKADIVFLRQQINELNNRLSLEQELHRNTQVLFKQQQVQDIKALETHQYEFDIKLSEIKESMEKRKIAPKDSIFKRLFKK